MPVGPDDVLAAAAILKAVLDPALDRDWSAPAGDLDWSCEETLHHIASCMLTYATHLASRAERGLPPVRLDVTTMTPSRLLRLAVAAAAVLAEAARAAPATARAYHPAGIADPEGWCAMGCDEILVHCDDIARGLRTRRPDGGDLAGRVAARLFPWAPTDGDGWQTLLAANGRLGERDADWTWQAAPLEERHA